MKELDFEQVDNLDFEQAVMGLKAIAHAGRLRILCVLIDGDKTVGDLADLLNLSQSAVSQHLSKMKAAGILLDRREGNQVYYSLKERKYRDLVSSICNIQTH